MIYYGFFDAAFDEKTGAYDRTYNSGDFVRYFENFIGSGVCVYNNPNSFKVSVSGTNAVIASGYLFIRGYWLKNDSDYAISFSGVGDGVYAVYAKLNLGARLIELGQMVKADSYTDTLVLAYVTISNGVLSVEDTRYNADICGVIDAVGSLTSKIEYAINYIDTQIESKLQQIEQDLQNQSDIINSKLDEANALIAKIAKPPIGTVKFSASSTIEDGWLKCDGSFISESQYPELVAALGKLIPSGDKFKLISDGEIGTNITNGVLYDGRMWVYSWSTQKLYGVDVNGEEPIKEIVITCDDTYFSSLQNPNAGNALALSIVDSYDGNYRIFLSQVIKETFKATLADVLFYTAIIDKEQSSLSLEPAFSSFELNTETSLQVIPYVISMNEQGVCQYYASIFYGFAYNYSYGTSTRQVYIYWNEQEKIAHTKSNGINYGVNPLPYNLAAQGQYYAFNKKNQNEAIAIFEESGTRISFSSYPNGFFDRKRDSTGVSYEFQEYNLSTKPAACCIVGNDKLLVRVDVDVNLAYSVDRRNLIPLQKASISDLSLPSGCKVFKDGACYLWGKDIYFIFVGTGIIFSRTLEEGSFGYLDTTSVLGQITQGGYMDYSQDEGTLYIMGQDTANKIKVAKIVLNTLYDYANDGAWLPLIASDGVPAWIKAKEVT